MKNRASSFLLLLLLVMPFSGCSKDNNAPVAGPVSATPTPSGPLDTTPPPSTVKLIFLHHSVGQNWLATGNGNLGSQLNANHYFVSDTNYGWNDPPVTPAHFLAFNPDKTVGSHTDTGDWPFWFTNDVMPAVYAESSNTCYSNTITDPGGANEIILFKSCYPNSVVGDSMADEQILYNSLLPYFAAHTDKMFVLCVPPPQVTISYPSVTRQLANWLVDRTSGWLSSYSGNNVFVFDLYNVLTDPKNHHRVNGGVIEHVVTTSPTNPSHPDELYYDTGGDSHPSAAGGQKATAELVPLLNAWYHQWKGL